MKMVKRFKFTALGDKHTQKALSFCFLQGSYIPRSPNEIHFSICYSCLLHV